MRAWQKKMMVIEGSMMQMVGTWKKVWSWSIRLFDFAAHHLFITTSTRFGDFVALICYTLTLPNFRVYDYSTSLKLSYLFPFSFTIQRIFTMLFSQLWDILICTGKHKSFHMFRYVYCIFIVFAFGFRIFMGYLLIRTYC